MDKARAVFDAAVAVRVDQRAAFVRERCGEDGQLAEFVLALLAEHDQFGTLVEPEAIGRAGPMPAVIGTYKVIRVLGEGGMGVVYEAEQASPRRRVAIKVVSASLRKPEVLSRFRHEAAVLARLQHPGIAQIYEAGTADIGTGPRPYFAMELVTGEPLSSYVQTHRPSTRERLALFEKVCQAVQHAHQKGVIHRDLKPANVLVDATGQPKILDFGVARLTDSDVRAPTMRTDIGQLIGTVPYMSPEQVTGNPEDLDTRSDVYALGVIMYEMLVERLPYPLDRKLIHEAVRVIREEEPTRLSSIDRTLRGDIEIIASKALEKDKSRRYQTASELASDVRKYLSDEPIAARAPSTLYQLRKFSRRNKGLVTGVLAAFGVLLAAITAVSLALNQTRLRADELKAVSTFQAEMLSQIDPARAGQMLTEDVTAKFAEALTEAGVAEGERIAQLEVFRSLWQRVNATDAATELIDRTILRPAVEAIDQQFQDQPILDAKLRHVLAERYYALGRYEQAISLGLIALEKRKRILGPMNEETLSSMNNVGVLLIAMGKEDEAESYFREAMERSLATRGETDRETLLLISNFAALLRTQDKLEAAEPYYRQVLEIRRRVLGEDDPSTIQSIIGLGVVLGDQGRHLEAEPYNREALERCRRVLDADHVDTLSAISNLGLCLQELGKLDEAEPYAIEALEMSRRVQGERHQQTLACLSIMGALAERREDIGKAELYHRQALELSRAELEDGHPDTLVYVKNMAVFLLKQDRLDLAESYFREVLHSRRERLPDDDPQTLSAFADLCEVLSKQRKHSEVMSLIEPVEGALHAALAGGKSRSAAGVLSLFARSRIASGFDPARFRLAETSLLELYPIFMNGGDEDRLEADACRRGLVDLYTLWHAAEPEAGYDARAEEWRAKLRTE